jgi:hypothetical protein
MIARPVLAVLATAAALGVMSCSGDATPPRFDRTALVRGSGSPEELRARWAQWRTLGPRSYDYELRRASGVADTPAWVEVRDGRVVRARALSAVDGRVILTGRPLPLDLFEPIDSLFAEAIRVSEAGERLLVSYDPSLGYPAWLTIGLPEADAGVIIMVPSLVVR